MVFYHITLNYSWKDVVIHELLIFPIGTDQLLKQDSRVHLLSLLSAKHTDLHHLNGERNEVSISPRVSLVKEHLSQCFAFNKTRSRSEVSQAPSVNVVLGFGELDIKCHNWGIIVHNFSERGYFQSRGDRGFDNGDHTRPEDRVLKIQDVKSGGTIACL